MDTATTTDSKTYTVLSGGESVFQIAPKVNMKPHDLMEHNGLQSYDIREGTVLHLPYVQERQTQDSDKYHYDIYPETQLYHVNNEGGTRKYAFGDVKTYTDIFPVSHTTKQNQTVRVAGEVTITFSPDRIYSYYLDDLAVKDGKVKKAIGFPKEYLTKGEAPVVAEPVVLPEPVQEKLQAVEAALEIPLPEPKPVEEPETNEDWKDSYVPLPDGPAFMKPRFACDVTDFDGKRPTKEHFYGNLYIAGTFLVRATENGATKFIEQGRPQTSVDNGSWYGINWSNLEDVQRPQSQLEDKAGQQYEVTQPDPKRLKVYESALFPAIGKGIAQGVKAIDYVKNKGKRKTI